MAVLSFWSICSNNTKMGVFFFLFLFLLCVCVFVCVGLTRDLKLENALLHREENGIPRVKICDFGYSKSNLLHSNPKSTVGTPAYIAPEVLTPGNTQQYNGQIADVWSCGVLLYVMLVGSYPFEDPNDQRNLRKSIQRTLACKYSYPGHVSISEECKHLLSRIFVLCDKRITIEEIRQHPWFLANLPQELQSEMLSRADSAGDDKLNELGQSIEEVKACIKVRSHDSRKFSNIHCSLSLSISISISIYLCLSCFFCA